MSDGYLTVSFRDFVLTFSPAAVEVLDHAIREHRRSQRAEKRDLPSEIASFLRDRPGVTVTEIARGIRARDQDVRHVLNKDFRFQAQPPGEGRSTRVKAWVLSREGSGVVPLGGTDSCYSSTGDRS
jgi:hypothetical protein